MDSNYETSEVLIAQANDFLDSINNINKNNIQKMEYLLEKMTCHGFKNPFKPVLSTHNDVELSAENKRDIKKQIRIMREEYLLKKNTLRRMKVAYAAHRIAIHINNTGYLQEILEHLPIKGDYIKKIASFDIYAYEAYLMIIDFLGTAGIHDSPSVMIKIKRLEGKNEIIENFKLINPHNIEERIKAIYGNSAQILGTRFINPEYKLIKGAEYRIALATALTAFANKTATSRQDSYSKKNILEKYHNVLSKYGISKYYRIDLVDGYENIKEELIKNNVGFYQEGEFFLNEEIWRSIETERNNLARQIFAIAKNILQQHLLEFMISGTQNNFLPNFVLSVPEAYATIFNEFRYNEKRLDLSTSIKEFIELKKFDLFENRLLISAICTNNGLDKNTIIEMFGINRDDLEKACNALLSIDLKKLRDFHEN